MEEAIEIYLQRIHDTEAGRIKIKEYISLKDLIDYLTSVQIKAYKGVFDDIERPQLIENIKLALKDLSINSGK